MKGLFFISSSEFIFFLFHRWDNPLLLLSFIHSVSPKSEYFLNIRLILFLRLAKIIDRINICQDKYAQSLSKGRQSRCWKAAEESLCSKYKTVKLGRVTHVPNAGKSGWSAQQPFRLWFLVPAQQQPLLMLIRSETDNPRHRGTHSFGDVHRLSYCELIFKSSSALNSCLISG